METLSQNKKSNEEGKKKIEKKTTLNLFFEKAIEGD